MLNYYYLAIDDVFLVADGTCEYFNQTTTTLKPKTSTPIPSFSCDFEKDLCDWQSQDSQNFKWFRQNGQNSKYGTAPLNDNTFKNSLGYYAMVDSKMNNSGSALLTSPYKFLCFKTDN